MWVSYTLGGGGLCYRLTVDRARIVSMLKAAEDHLANGARRIAKQRDLVSRLGRAGEDASDAVAVLQELQRAQEQYLDGRDRLRAELDRLSAAETESAGSADPKLHRRHRRRSRRTPYGIR